MSTYDPPVGLILTAVCLCWLTAYYAKAALRHLDAWSQHRADYKVAHVLDADEAFWTLPAGRGEHTPTYDALVCEQYEREFNEEAS